MERIALLHGRLQLTISGLLIILVLWGLLCAARGGVGRSYVAGLWVAQLLLLAQGALGTLMLAGGAPLAGQALHVIYGVVAALVIPAALAYNRGRATRWEALVLAAACLFLLGVVIRAFETAG